MRKTLLTLGLTAFAVFANAQDEVTYNFFDPADCDAEGWLWLDSQAKIDKYVGAGKKIQLVNAQYEIDDPEFPGEYITPKSYTDATLKGYNTDGVEGGEGSKTGGIVLPTAFDDDWFGLEGGGILVAMPDCASFDVYFSQPEPEVHVALYGAREETFDPGDCKYIWDTSYDWWTEQSYPLSTDYVAWGLNLQDYEYDYDYDGGNPDVYTFYGAKGQPRTAVVYNYNMDPESVQYVQGLRIKTYTDVSGASDQPGGEEPSLNVLETVELSYEADANTDYEAGTCEFDMEKVLSLLGCTVEDLQVVSFDAEGEVLPQTANNGYWYNAKGEVCNYGDNSAWFIEYRGSDDENDVEYNSWMIGNFPVFAGGNGVSSIGFCFEENAVMFNIDVTINEVEQGDVNVLKTINLSYQAEPNDDYNAGPCEFDANEVMELLGCTMDDVQVISLNEAGEVLIQTGNNGYWFNTVGEVCNWGEGAGWYIEYWGSDDENDVEYNSWMIGNFPGLESAKGVSNIGFAFEENAVMFNITVTIGEDAGVDGIATDSDVLRVYNLQGVRVNPENLTNGLYIINGKKVMIKK